MSVYEYGHLLYTQIAGTEAIQWLAVALGIAEVIFAKSNRIWLFPTGIAGTLLSIYILLEAGLFAESILNGYYVVMSIYGWWYWIKKKRKPRVNISSCNKADWMMVITITGVSFILLLLFLKYGTVSSVPIWDAWVSATAWAGMWLLSRRKIENWILLNISNLFAIPLLLYKQLPLFAVLTLFLFIMAILGYYEWRLLLKRDSTIIA